MPRATADSGQRTADSWTAVGAVGILGEGDESRCAMPSRGCACTTGQRVAANGGGGWTGVMIWCEPVKAQFTHDSKTKACVCTWFRIHVLARLLAPVCGRSGMRRSGGDGWRGQWAVGAPSRARNKSTHAGGHTEHTHAARRDGDNDRPGAA
jgi:hypothetical protein